MPRHDLHQRNDHLARDRVAHARERLDEPQRLAVGDEMRQRRRGATDALAYNVRVLRAKRNVSQVVLAAEAKMTTATISGTEKSEGNPTLETLQKLANALGVDVAALFAKAD